MAKVLVECSLEAKKINVAFIWIALADFFKGFSRHVFKRRLGISETQRHYNSFFKT